MRTAIPAMIAAPKITRIDGGRRGGYYQMGGLEAMAEQPINGNRVYPAGDLARGGTYCECGAEKDRRAKHCKRCVARTWFDEPRRVARRERSARYLADSRAGLTTREIAALAGINHQNVSRLIRLGRADENLTTPKITRIDGGKGGRHYRVEGYPEPFPSVTNVLGIIAKPALIPWARNTALEAVGATLTARVGERVEL